MTTAPDPALLDTNVLVYGYYQQSPQHAASRTLLDQAQNAGAGLCVVPQNLAEFYSIVTNPKRVTQAKSSSEALDLVAEILALPGMTLLPVPLDIVARWTQLIRQYPVTGQKVFDIQLVAMMLGNGVSKLYTYNIADFRNVTQVQAVTP